MYFPKAHFNHSASELKVGIYSTLLNSIFSVKNTYNWGMGKAVIFREIW